MATTTATALTAAPRSSGRAMPCSKSGPERADPDASPAKAPMTEDVAKRRPGVADQRIHGFDPRNRFGDANQRERRQRGHPRDGEQSNLGSKSRHYQAGDGGTDDGHQRIATGVEPIGAVP